MSMMSKMLYAVFAAQAVLANELELELENEEREIELEVDGAGFEFEAEGSNDRFRVRADLSPDADDNSLLEFRMRHESETTDTTDDDTTDTTDDNTTDTTTDTTNDKKKKTTNVPKYKENEVETEFRLQILSIIEYEESGNVTGYQPDQDTSVSVFNVDSTSWNDWVTTHDCLSASADCYFQLDASTTDNVFATSVYFTTSPTNLENMTLTPNQVKFDLLINNFAYQGVDTYLAIEAALRIDVEGVDVDDDDDSDNEGIIITAGTDVGGFFNWLDVVVADGENVNVISTVGDNFDEFYFAFDVVQAGSIYWDPSFGLQGMGINTASTISTWVAAFTMVAVQLF